MFNLILTETSNLNNVKNPNSDPFLLLPTDRTKKAARDETRSWEMVRSRRVVFTLTQQGEEAGGVPIFCISFLMIFASNKLAGDISSYSREGACLYYIPSTTTSILLISHIITRFTKEKVRNRIAVQKEKNRLVIQIPPLNRMQNHLR